MDNTFQFDSRNKTLSEAMQWISHVPASEQHIYHERLVNARRNYNKIRFAVEERPSVAAFGESQMGKSYLVSALLSQPDVPFCVTNGGETYNFINDINPSSPNSTIEATGVITRFSTKPRPEVPQGFLRAQLLSVPDLVLVLCEAYFNQIDYSHESIMEAADVDERLSNVPLTDSDVNDSMINEDGLLDIEEYLRTSPIQKKCSHLLNSTFFKFLLANIRRIPRAKMVELIKLAWYNNPEVSKLFDDILDTYQQLNFCSEVYVEFKSVLKKHGTLLDVARLDEICGAPEVQGSEFEPMAKVQLPGGKMISLPKSYLSALIAEINFSLHSESAKKRDFLNYLDILDFPGARRPEQIKESKLAEGKNLSTVLRRGKVSYLFNKYSIARRITALLFCHNNNQSAESTMGALLTHWVSTNIGPDPAKRGAYVQSLGVSPLFIIGTWFNKDLDYQDEKPGDDDRLNERWQRRFSTVLEKEVLKSLGDDSHWFNKWSQQSPVFSNIFMLRDFKYSTSIFSGWDPDHHTMEQSVIKPEKFPDFLLKLKQSFVSNDFVKAHFLNPEAMWQGAATVGHDGTEAIISTLDKLAPNVAEAREKKFIGDFRAQDTDLKKTLSLYYHPDGADAQIRLANRQAAVACLTLDMKLGQDPYFFGRLMTELMISEEQIYELVFTQIQGAKLRPPMSNEESSIFMSAGLESTASRDANVDRLCTYLSAIDEQECREILADMGIDIEKLLSQSQMQNSVQDDLVAKVEDYWHNQFLADKCVTKFKEDYPPINSIVSKLWALYKLLNMHKLIAQEVGQYMSRLTPDASVGIIADVLAMRFNEFVDCFGFNFIPDDDKANIAEQNQRFALGLKENELSIENAVEGAQLLADLPQKEETLTRQGYNSPAGRALLLRYPQFRVRWQWEQRLRLGFALATKMPDYDPKANAEMGKILDSIK